jgi:hypothetical protein
VKRVVRDIVLLEVRETILRGVKGEGLSVRG